jgi:hypothetical protein
MTTTNRRMQHTPMFPLFYTVVGGVVLMNALASPNAASFRGLDVMRLIAAGFCFGAAFVTLVVFVRGTWGRR